ATVTRFSSISTKNLSNALKTLTIDKSVVATSDYNEFHKLAKRFLLRNILGSNAQEDPLRPVNFREIFESEIYGLAMKQALGEDVQSIYVEGLGTTLSRKEIKDTYKGANNNVGLGAIAESADTTLVTTGWAMYQLAKDPTRQDRLYDEMRKVCGCNKVKEENLSQLRCLDAVFHETLRKHSPAPLVPIRRVHENTQIGGYYIPAGSEIAVNIYGRNMDKNHWESGEAIFLICVTIGRLVQEFEWRLNDGEEEKVDTVGLTSQKLHPLFAIVKPRE
ncbi:hypothetical protein Goklo_011301, partial [Gossypium klotzschianum]|nr:hypothetical protein [Gossypium klotzschianum]